MMMIDGLSPLAHGDLPGWREADHGPALAAFRRSAREIMQYGSGFHRAAVYGGSRKDWLSVCALSESVDDGRRFFEENFRAFRVTDVDKPDGLFTGYYEPLVLGSRVPHADFPVPVYARPSDLVAFTPEEVASTGLRYGKRVGGKPVGYETRQQIEDGALTDRAEVLCWLSDWVDAFFMHVQGQGRVAFADGTFLRLSFAAKNGHAYTGIGQLLVERGVCNRETMSMQVLRGWMKARPAEARELMWQNKSYIFFQKAIVDDPALGGVGAAKVNLTPLHSLAVDRTFWMFGTPLWIDTSYPSQASDRLQPFQRLMIAQDTGSAIKGLVRGDVFWGAGDEAAHIAGHMKSAGQMTALLPYAVSRRIGFS